VVEREVLEASGKELFWQGVHSRFAQRGSSHFKVHGAFQEVKEGDEAARHFLQSDEVPQGKSRNASQVRSGKSEEVHNQVPRYVRKVQGSNYLFRVQGLGWWY